MLETLSIIFLFLIPLFLFFHLILQSNRFLFKTLEFWTPLVAICLFVLYIYGVNRMKFFLLTSDKISNYEVTLTLNDSSVVKTDSSFVFVGATKNYFFFREIKTKVNTIIPTSRIIYIKEKDLSKWETQVERNMKSDYEKLLNLVSALIQQTEKSDYVYTSDVEHRLKDNKAYKDLYNYLTSIVK